MTFFIPKDTRCQSLRRELELARVESNEAAEILKQLKNSKEETNEKQQS